MRAHLNRGELPGAASTDAVDRFKRLLHDRALRVTDIRVAIVKAALSRVGHFTADELVHDVQALGFQDPRATVYRAIPLLLESGILQPTVVSGERRLYEVAFGKEHHDHLICNRCGTVVEFQFEAFEMLQRDLAEKHGFRLTAHFHELIGVCASCQESERHAS
jgi:Fur family transcriptional regulator, ferric uptake regulator